jgi:hypothetical protein
MNRRKAIKELGLSLGYVVSAPAVIGILQSCEEKKENWTALFFNENEKSVVPYLVDIILPASDTPGGLDLNLPQFTDMMCQDILESSDKELFHEGSEIFASQFKAKFNKDMRKAKKEEVKELFSAYFDLEEEQSLKVKKLLIQDINSLSAGEKENYKLYKFLVTVRRFSLLGYFTSEKIGKEVLNFDPIPGRYDPCIPVSEVGNAWTI